MAADEIPNGKCKKNRRSRDEKITLVLAQVLKWYSKKSMSIEST